MNLHAAARDVYPATGLTKQCRYHLHVFQAHFMGAGDGGPAAAWLQDP
jgi:hypothetical protein